MPLDYLNFEQFKSRWPQRFILVNGTVELATRLFVSWSDNSVWHWLDYLGREMTRTDRTKLTQEAEANFLAAMVEASDFALLSKIKAVLEEMDKILAPVSADMGKKPDVSGVWLKARQELNLADSGVENLAVRALKLPEDSRIKVVQNLSQLSSLYAEFKKPLSLVAALLLFYTPTDVCAGVKEFRETSAKLLAQDKISPEQWAPAMRYLGQSFYGREMEAAVEAVKILTENQKLEQLKFKDQVYNLLYIVLLHLVFSNFKELYADRQDDLIFGQSWWALALGVPLEEILKEKLAAEENVNYYIYSSGSFARNLLASEQFILDSDQEKVLVKNYLSEFLLFAQKEDTQPDKQTAYLDETIKRYKWPEDLREPLLRLINLYLNLRDGSLTDYRGLLSEAGLKKKYDWSALLGQDLDEAKLAEVRRYFEVVERPIRVKIELIAAFSRLPWDNEVYLPRVLALSNLYEEFYGPNYGSLAYFDEKEGKWKINKELPDLIRDSLKNF